MRVRVAVCVVAIVLGLCGAAPVLRERVAAESAGSGVELVIDYDEVVTLAGATGRAPDEVLEALKAGGVTGVGIPEDSIKSLIDTGRAEQCAQDSVRAQTPGCSCNVRIRCANAARKERVEANLRAKWHVTEVPEDPLVLAVDGSLERLEKVGVGWDLSRVDAVRRAGLAPVARPLDTPVISPVGLRKTFDEIDSAGLQGVLFQGKFVLGNSDLIAETAHQLRTRAQRYYAIELDVQQGTEQLSRLLDGQVIRTHSIGEAELLKLSRDTAVDRFGRGVRERGIRCCFVRLFLDRASDDPLEFNRQYIVAVRHEVDASGLAVGPATLPPLVNVTHRLDPVIGIGIAGGAALLLLQLLGPTAVWAVLSGLGMLVCAGAPMVASPGRALVALVGAVSFPTVAALAIRLDRAGGAPWRRCAGALLLAATITSAGGLLVAGMVSDTLTMTKVDQFRGVKLALAAPVLVVGLAYGLGLLDLGEPIAERLRLGSARLRTFLGHRMTLGAFLLIVVLAGAGGYWLLRSGNAGASAQSGLEKAMRTALESILVYRPRTKEFLIGHPALVLAAYLAARGRTAYATPLAVLVAVGLTSLLNTFCHIHSPLAATALRSLYGVLLGGLIGWVVCAVSARALPAGTGPSPSEDP